MVEKYNELKEDDVLVISVLEDFSDEIITLYQELKVEINSFVDMGIDLEEKSFYDILKALAKKYDLSYPEEKLLELTMGEILIIKNYLCGSISMRKGHSTTMKLVRPDENKHFFKIHSFLYLGPYY